MSQFVTQSAPQTFLLKIFGKSCRNASVENDKRKWSFFSTGEY
jgi:hypothetical protein